MTETTTSWKGGSRGQIGAVVRGGGVGVGVLRGHGEPIPPRAVGDKLGELRRLIEYRAAAHDRDVERLLVGTAQVPVSRAVSAPDAGALGPRGGGRRPRRPRRGSRDAAELFRTDADRGGTRQGGGCMASERALAASPPARAERRLLNKEVPVNADQWLAVGALGWLVVLATMFLFFAVDGDVRDLRYEIGDLRRDVGAVQREIEFRAEQDERDVERLLSELRRLR